MRRAPQLYAFCHEPQVEGGWVFRPTGVPSIVCLCPNGAFEFDVVHNFNGPGQRDVATVFVVLIKEGEPTGALDLPNLPATPICEHINGPVIA
jgi:hypothetical protein